MNSRIFKGALAALTMAMLVIMATPVFAASMANSATAPTVDGADIANLDLGNITGQDKWWTDTNAQGQSFTTGSDPVLLNSITYYIDTTMALATKQYNLRVGTLSGTSFGVFHSETATQDFHWNTTDTTTIDGKGYMTWTFDSPVFLSAGAMFGVEIDMISSTTAWQTGIPYTKFTNDQYADGARFYSNGVVSTVGVDNSRDRIFHVDLSTGPLSSYWDLNGTTAGAGGATPTGTWDAAGTNWNAVSDGTGTTAAWTAGQTAVFAAGTDATGTYTVTVDGTQDIGGLKFEEGDVTLSGGTALRITGVTMMNVASGQTATIATPISEDAGGRQLVKTGDGTLVLSGSNNYSGSTAIPYGTLRLGAVDALPNGSDVSVGDYGGSGAAATLDLNGNSVTLGSLTLVDNATVTSSGAATLTTSALIYDSGTLNLGTTALNAEELEVNANLDLSASQVAATSSVLVANATLTVGHDVATETLTLDGGAIVGGAATASTKYSLTNIADYSADITGATADLVIGEGGAADQRVKLSGTGNTYGGITQLDTGYLEVSADAANLGTGQLVFNGGSLQTSGTFTGKLGAANDIRQQVAALKFAATDAPLTVTVERADGTTDPLQFSYGSNTENGTSSITLGSPTSTAMVEFTNDLIAGHGAPGGGGQSYHVKIDTVDNPNSSNDIALVSGDITNPAPENLVQLEKGGTGTLWLTGTNTDFSKTYIKGGDQSILRAVDGVGLSPTALLHFEGGVLESSGTFTREIGNTAGNRVDPGKVYFNKEGGFSAYGAPLTVSLTPAGGAAGDLLTWNSNTLGFNNKNLYMGSPTADNVVTLTNPISEGGGHKTIYVSGNPDVDTDWAVMGTITKTSGNITIRGTVNPGELRVGDITTVGSYIIVDTGATLRVNGTASAGRVQVKTGSTLGGTGTIDTVLEVQSGGILAPGNSVGTLTATGNTTLSNGSIYEWEVGQLGETDVLNATGGTLNIDDFVLKILDADGYVASAADQLPVFTYSGATIDMGGFPNTAANFDTSALGGTWTVGALSLTDDMAGMIYLTGLSGGLPPFIVWDGGDGNWNVAADWEPDGPTTASSNCVVEKADDHLHVTDAQPAGSLAITAGMVDVESPDGDLAVTNDVNVGENGTLNVAGNLSAAEVICDGTLSGTGRIEADFIEITGVASPGGSVGTLTVDGELELIEATYLCEIDSTGADRLHNANEAEAVFLSDEGGGATLELVVLEGLGVPGCYTDTILSTSGAGVIEGDFAVKPAEGDYLAYGVFLKAYEVPDPAIAYNLNLFQAGEGDTDGDGDVDLDDLSVLDDGWDPTAEDKLWTDGDVDGDGDVDLDDLSLLDDNWAPAGYPVINCPFGGGGLGAVAVPEPGTLVLLAMSLVGLAVLAVRRRRRVV